jgi:cardiolipin synthase A/B
MKYKLYKTSWKAWDAMLHAIDQAKKSVYLEMYIFLDDTSESHDFLGKLKQKAREGLRVVIIADSFGSSELKKESVEALRQAGVEFLFFSHWLRHIHRKILVVDEKIAFIGGVNIGKKFALWNDLQLRFSGRMVKTIAKSFAYTYEIAGGKNPKILALREKSFAKKFRFWIMEHSPIKNIYSLKDQYQEKISAARKSIRMVTPYFTPPRWLRALLDSAIQRGVSIEIIIPKKTDLPIINRINHRYMHDLSLRGVQFFLTKKMNHSKALLIDNEIGLIGSQNIDHLSFEFNSEAGMFSKDKYLIRELAGIMDKWKKDAQEFSPQKYKMKFIDYIILALLKILNPIL